MTFTSGAGVDERHDYEPVELVALGRCDLRINGLDARAVVAQPKRFGLLVYLALARPRGPHQRDELLALFWPTLSERRARQALSQSLYFLATTLGHDAIQRDGKALVGVGRSVSSDVLRFERLLEQGRLPEALAEYDGELLPGLHVTGCGDFERWLEGERRRLRSEAVRAARVLSDQYLAEDQEDDAVKWSKWELRQLPYDEDAAAGLFQLLSRLGRTGELRREFEAYERRLRGDLQLEPPPHVLELIPAPVRAVAPPATSDSGQQAERLAPSTGPRRGWLAASLIAIVSLGIVGWALRGTGGSALPAPERSRVTVLPFETAVEDVESSQLARVASDWVARKLAASGIASVVAPRAATAPSGETGGVDGDSMTNFLYLAEPPTGLVVSGLVHSKGERVAIEVSIREAASQRIVRVVPRAEGVTSEAMDVVEELSNRVAATLATTLDERIGSWAEVSSQPPSVEAYRAFFDGLDWFARGEADSADHYFFEAARQDSLFTAPLIWAVRSRVWAHRIAEADSLAQALAPKRKQLAPWDRAMLDHYIAYLHGTWEQAYLAARQVELLAPDPEWTQLVASAAQAANRPRAALEALTRIDQDEGWARNWPYRWRTWTIVHHMLGQYEAELESAAPQRGEHPVSVAMTEINAFAGLGRLEAVHSTLGHLRDLVKNPNGRVQILRRAVDELRAHGHEAVASPVAAEALGIVDSLVAAGDTTPDRLHLQGDILYLAGQWHEAHALLSSLDKEDDHGTLLTSRGRAAGRIGLEAEARQAAADLLTDDPLDKGHNTFRAATILAALGDEAEATNLLRRAVAEGFGFYPWLHTVWEFENLADYEPFQALVRPRD